MQAKISLVFPQKQLFFHNSNQKTMISALPEKHFFQKFQNYEDNMDLKRFNFMKQFSQTLTLRSQTIGEELSSFFTNHGRLNQIQFFELLDTTRQCGFPVYRLFEVLEPQALALIER
ncbi:MAG: hypothetical protein Q8P05_06080 [Candidatus Diapherotrites archaeon]|nr:hypothetical protein [Candidatus Diapherotrites archaeon]